jgi:nucleotide-binding universal stress UspA family protein
MTNGEKERVIQRILIALDGSPHSLAALKAAADLAEHLEAELTGIYVEDINLIRSSDMPAMRQVSYYSALARKFGREQMEEELRAQANRIRRTLALTAQRSRLSSSFRVTRGVILDELLRAVEDADLMIIGKAGWSHRRRAGSTARGLVLRCPRQILVLQEGGNLGYILALVYDGSPASELGLQAALDLLKRRPAYLSVILVSEGIEQARQMQEQVNRELREHDQAASFRWLLAPRVKTLTMLIKSEGYGALILPAELNVLPAEGLPDLLDELDIPILIVR